MDSLLKILTITTACLCFFCGIAFAELRMTAFGVLDTDETDVRVDYNVETSDGLESKSLTVSRDIAENDEALQEAMGKLNAVKYVFSPGAVPKNVQKRALFSYSKGESKATREQLNVRRHMRARSLIQVEARKFYKEKIPKAVAPLGQFINAKGASMIVTDKYKKPLGTLLISYTISTVPLPLTSAENEQNFKGSNVPTIDNAPFFLVSEIPRTWRSRGMHDRYYIYELPSSERILVTHVGKFFRCYAFVLKIEAVFTFNKISRKKK